MKCELLMRAGHQSIQIENGWSGKTDFKLVKLQHWRFKPINLYKIEFSNLIIGFRTCQFLDIWTEVLWSLGFHKVNIADSLQNGPSDGVS